MYGSRITGKPPLGMEDVEIFDVELGKNVDIIYNSYSDYLFNQGKTGEYGGSQPSIFWVPEVLRKVKPDCYTPRLVSIGPFHKGDVNVQGYEAHKMWHVLHLLDRLCSSREDILKECIRVVFHKIDEIRSCYKGKSIDQYSDYQLAWMMVIDACFILDFIYRFTQDKRTTGSIFDIDLLTAYVLLDMILLENQIPYFVLQDIFDLTIRKFVPTTSLSKFLLSWLPRFAPFPSQIVTNFDDTNFDHMVGFLHKCHQPLVTETGLVVATRPVRPISAVDLSRAGVKFKKSTDNNWKLAINFISPSFSCLFWSWRKTTLSLPCLQIQNHTETILRNLIAYEQLTPEVGKHVTSYVGFIISLLYREKDMEKLIESGVIECRLGSSKEASDMINSLRKEVSIRDFSYAKEWCDLYDYYHSFWPRNIAFLRRTVSYFSTPWSFIGLIGTMVLFVLTMVQTHYTIHPPS